MGFKREIRLDQQLPARFARWCLCWWWLESKRTKKQRGISMINKDKKFSYFFFFHDGWKSITIIITINIDVFFMFFTSKYFHFIGIGLMKLLPPPPPGSVVGVERFRRWMGEFLLTVDDDDDIRLSDDIDRRFIVEDVLIERSSVATDDDRSVLPG